MKIRTFFVIGLLIGATDVVYGAQAEDDDPFGLAEFNAVLSGAEREGAAIATDTAEGIVGEFINSIEQRDRLNKELFRSGCSAAKMRDLIAQGADVTAQDEWGWIPLHYARTPEVVEVLIDENPSVVNYQNKGGSTPLHIAVNGAIRSHENEGIIKMLLEAGADPDIPNNKGITPRQLAEQRGHQRFLPELPEHGVKTKPAVVIRKK